MKPLKVFVVSPTLPEKQNCLAVQGVAEADISNRAVLPGGVRELAVYETLRHAVRRDGRDRLSPPRARAGRHFHMGAK